MSYEPVEPVGILLSGIKEGGGIVEGGGGSRGGGGSAIMGGFVLSTTVSMVAVDGTRDRLGSSSAIDDMTDSIDCLRSEAEVRERANVPLFSRKRFESGPGAATGP